jgi:hypothetical protein
MAAITATSHLSRSERVKTWKTRFEISAALQAEFSSGEAYAAYMEAAARGAVSHHGVASPYVNN